MGTIDIIILFAYLLGTMLFGFYFSRSQKDVNTYFKGTTKVPAWVIMASIVSTETSSVTFLSVPGYAFTGNFTFLQLAMGYIIGRFVVSFLFVPLYFRGELLTVYQLLGQRFGGGVRRLASLLFLITRSLADGIRLFITGVVLAEVLLALPGTEAWALRWFSPLSPRISIIIVSVLIMGVVTIVFSYFGGMSAVIWTDVTQLGIYLIGAATATWVLLNHIPGGWEEVMKVGEAAGKFKLFDFTVSLTKSYTFWSGLIGGAFLTTATHGTDQLMVQRYLCGDSPRNAKIALIFSGFVVFFQFALFLFIGSLLYVFYTLYASNQIASFTVNGRILGDHIFPHFIVTQMPTGVVGLVIAAIAAAAFTSSLNSQAATTVADFYMPMTNGKKSDQHYLNISKRMTAIWGIIQIAFGLFAIKVSQNAVNEVLGIASFTNGLILGVFFIGTLTKRVTQIPTIIGMVSGLCILLVFKFYFNASWQWYALIGSTVTFLVGCLVSLILGEFSNSTESHGEPREGRGF